jgi:SAM-dependent methyltransferase
MQGSTVGEDSATTVARSYETLYESHAREDNADTAVGEGDFDVKGRVELDLLLMEGLKPEHTLIDFGCGNGRLAVHAIPALVGGFYIGIDISETFLRRARDRVRKRIPVPPCRVGWVKQATPPFPLEDECADMICAFSVFTHMEHEDSFRYLREAVRLMRPGGRFIFSCLPMNLGYARDVFLQQASIDLQTRWSRVRNVTTSVDLMTEIVRMAGWTPLRWYAGDELNIGRAGGQMRALEQSSCVLEVTKGASSSHLVPSGSGR